MTHPSSFKKLEIELRRYSIKGQLSINRILKLFRRLIRVKRRLRKNKRRLKNQRNKSQKIAQKRRIPNQNKKKSKKP